MATVLSLGGISLPAALIWQDRESFSPVEQSVDRTLGGRLVVEHAALVKGRPVTIVSERNQGWVDYATVKALQAIADVAGGVFTLQVDVTTWQVMFRHEDPPAFAAEPLVKRLAPSDTDWFLINMKLMTV